MNVLLVFLPGLMLLITLINFITIRRPWNISQIEETVSILVPLRNEAHNVKELLEHLEAQNHLSNVTFFFLDDNSEDDTYSKLKEICDRVANFTLISGSELPKGWIGKTWALQQLLEKSSGEIIVTTDADVRLTPDAISKSITLLNQSQLDFLSPYPFQEAYSWSEKLIQPLLQWSWFSTVILRLAERSSMSSTVVANGQFFIVRRAALTSIGGYEVVKNRVLDDVALGRELVKSGSHGGVVDGSKIASTHMYSSWDEIQAGYGKSLNAAFGTFFGSVCAIALIFITGIAPLIAGICGSQVGWLAFALIVLTRTLSAIKVGKTGIVGLLHPLACALLIYLIVYSWLMRGEIKWKGRTI
jgi:glycosyltransferase involved in cell wall biosynthesis